MVEHTECGLCGEQSGVQLYLHQQHERVCGADEVGGVCEWRGDDYVDVCDGGE